MPCIVNMERETSTIKENEKNEIMGNEYFDKEKIIEVKDFESPDAIEKSISCVCSLKGKGPYSFTLEDLEQKRVELINLQKTIVSFRHSRNQKRKSDAKLLKLSVNSKFDFANPNINMNFETLKKIDYENELVKSEIYHISNSNMKQCLTDSHHEEKIHILKNINESFYKMFVGRVGHLSGENKTVFIILSSEAFYIINGDSCTKLNEILYQEIETIIIGENERWFSIVRRGPVGLNNEDLSHFQIDIGDSATTKSIIKYLEVAVRRRLIALSYALSKRVIEGMNLKLDPKINSQFGLAENTFAPKRKCFSIGRWLEPFLPSVLSCSVQEINYIENWLMEQLKAKERPRVLACWLVFWENGSEFWCEKEPQVDPGPCVEGFLMVNNSLQHNPWTPAYFFLKGGILYQFRDPCDQLPQFVIRVREYCGCRRLPSDSRPHSFELLSKEGNSLVFAAPNEETASQWLQAFLRLLSVNDDEYKEKRKLHPCQIIQTTDALVLSYQTNILNDLKSNVFRSKNTCRKGRKLSQEISPILSKGREKFTSSKSSNPFHTTRNLEIKNIFRRPSSKGMLISSTPKDTFVAISTSVPVNFEDKATNLKSCPPTPPLPEITAEKPGPDSETRQKIFIDKPQPSLQLLAFCNLDQISDIFITLWPTNGCLMEFECSEASEIAGDWALYFQSEHQLSSFLKSVLECRESLTEELMGLTKVSSGRVHELLLEGSATCKNYWRPSK